MKNIINDSEPIAIDSNKGDIITVFSFNPNKEYHMPGFFGPRAQGINSRRYNDVTKITVCYLTDAKKLAQYIPAPFEVAEIPMVIVEYSCAKEVDWLAGRGYNMIGVNAAVKFNGKEDQLEGALALVMWESLTDPILTGREIKGVPKIYADIPDHQVINGEWRANASHFSNRIVQITAGDLTALTSEQIVEAKKSVAGKNHWMGWKYIPNPDGVGAAISHPTLFPTEFETTEAWTGKGTVEWEHLTWEQNPTQYHIVNALAELPNLGVVYSAVSKGSSVLEPEGRPVRLLK